MDDPLRHTSGNLEHEDGMEDLTSHLDGIHPFPSSNMAHGHAQLVPAEDALDLGDASELSQAPHADPLLSGHMGGDAHRGLMGMHDPNSPLSSSTASLTHQPHPGFATYGQLVPPSYEESMMYESASSRLAAASALHSSDPLSSSPPGAAAAATAAAHRGSGSGNVGQPAASLPPASLTVAAPGSASPLQPLGETAPILHADPLPGIKLQYTVPLDADAAAGGVGQGLPGSGAGGLGASGAPTSPNGSGGGAGTTAALPLRPSQRGAALRITVTEPQRREQQGLFGIKNGFVSYLVTSTWSPAAAAATHLPCSSSSPSLAMPPQAKPQAAVRRRFRDFVALADILKVRFRGYFIPPRPEKNAVEGQRMADTFVEERRVALERYMSTLAVHPVLSRSEELALFLSVEGELADSPAWRALTPLQQGSLMEGTALLSKQILGLEKKVLDPVQAAQPTRKSADPLRALKETAQSMQAVQRSPEEQALHRSREAAEAHKEVLLQASKAAEQLVVRMDKVALVQGDLGLALFKVASYEEMHGGCLAQFTGTVRQHQQLAACTKAAGNALVRASRVSRTATGKTALELGTLHEFLALMPAIHKGLRQREKQLLTAETLQGDLEARQRAIRELEAAGAKVLGGDQGRQRRVTELQNEGSRLEMSIMAAKAEYDRIKGANLQELVRVQGEMRVDFSHMLRMYCLAQAASAERLLEVWLQAAGELGAGAQELADAKASYLGEGTLQGGPSGGAAGAGAGASS